MSKQMQGITTGPMPPVRVAVIGFGTVGSTIARLCVQRGFDVKVYDTAVMPAMPPPTSEGVGLVRTFAEAVDVVHTTAVIICVPTPPAPSGGHDTSALQSTLLSLGQVRCLCPVLTMSTVCPGTMARFAALHPNLRLFHCPEFLSSATKEYDLLHCDRAMLGVTPGMPAAMIDRALALLKRMHPNAAERIRVVKSSESEAAKLFCNVFYAIKVRTFAGFHAACGAMTSNARDVPNYDTVQSLMVGQGWINPMHTYIPGSGGTVGVSGASLPKDCQAAISWLGVAPAGTLSKELLYMKAVLELGSIQ
jgi:UDP-glucose 6-dehydrogenase